MSHKTSDASKEKMCSVVQIIITDESYKLILAQQNDHSGLYKMLLKTNKILH